MPEVKEVIASLNINVPSIQEEDSEDGDSDAGHKYPWRESEIISVVSKSIEKKDLVKASEVSQSNVDVVLVLLIRLFWLW